MVLKTKTKIAMASIAYRFVHGSRAMVGKDNQAVVRRAGHRWSLDLNEGIDFSIYLFGAFEPGTVATLKKLVKAGDTVFDIGANVGAHTLGLAGSVGPSGKVFAFEPTDFAVEKLKRNVSLNPELQSRIQIFQMLLTDNPAESLEGEIYASWPLTSDASLHPKHRGRLVTTRGASVETLDNVVERQGIERLDLIKIDVDGHEYPVLKGAIKTLGRFRPRLVMEMSPYVHAEHQHSFSALIDLLLSQGYGFRDAASWQLLPGSAGELERLIPDGAGINVIATAA